MKILVTGGAGYIGSHTCVELLEAGHDVVIVDNLYNASRKAVDRIAEIAGKAPVFCQADICDRAALEQIFDAHSFDAVIHFAGYKAVGESVAKPVEYYTNNLYGTLTLTDVMRSHGVKKIISAPPPRCTGTRLLSRLPRTVPRERAPIPTDGPSGCWNRS